MTIETDKMIIAFTAALRQKLDAAEIKYGYEDNSWMDTKWQETLRKDLRDHLEKGDPLDVAAYCAFAWHHEWSV